jgi:hypothetical protein
MLNQKERLENFKANADQVEMEANSRLQVEAIEMLQKGFTERFVANKCFLPIKVVKELKDKFI